MRYRNPLPLAGEGLGEGGAAGPELCMAGPTTLTPTLSRQREREMKRGCAKIMAAIHPNTLLPAFQVPIT